MLRKIALYSVSHVWISLEMQIRHFAATFYNSI